MGNLAITVDNLGKCYRIGQAQTKPSNLREAIGGDFLETGVPDAIVRQGTYIPHFWSTEI